MPDDNFNQIDNHKNLIIMIALAVSLIASGYYLTLTTVSHAPFFVNLFAAVIILYLLKPDTIITDPTKIRELFVSSQFGKQVGLKSLGDIKGVDIQREMMVNPYDKSKIYVWWFFSTTWVDCEVYSGEYKVGESLDKVLLRYVNHRLETKSLDVIRGEIKKQFLSGDIKDSIKRLREVGILHKPTPQHRDRSDEKETPDEVARPYDYDRGG